MVERSEFFLEQDLSEENFKREIKKTNEKLNHIEKENRELKEQLAFLERNRTSKVIKTLSIFTLIGSFFLFSSNMTGYFVSEEIDPTTNFISIILFGLGLLGIYLSKKI